MGLKDWVRRATTVPGTHAAKDTAAAAKDTAARGAAAADTLKEQAYTSHAGTREEFNNAQAAIEGQVGQFRELKDNLANKEANLAEVGQAKWMRERGASEIDKTRLGAASTVANTQLGNASQAQAAQLSPQQRAQSAQLRPAAQTQAAQIQGGQSQQQDALLSALTNQALGKSGPSAADLVAQRSMEQNMQQQMSAAASARGGVNAGMVQRGMAQNIANTNQSINRDAMIARAQEQQGAQELAAQSLGQARGQDIQLGSTQAQLSQQANLANQSAANQFSLQQGSMEQQANLQNAQLATELNMQQGQMQQQTNLANQSAANQFALQQGALNQQSALANQDALNQSTLQQGLLDQQTNIAQASANDQAAQFYLNQEAQRRQNNASLQQQANQFNATTQNQFDFNQLAGLQNLIGAEAGAYTQSLDLERMRNQDLANALTNVGNLNIGVAGAQGAASGAQLAPGGASMSLLGSLIQGGGTIATAMSDKKSKRNFTSQKTGNKKLIDALKSSKEYSYKEGYGQDTKKRYFGPMANDLPDSLVLDNNGIKMVDTGRFALSLGSVVGQQQEQIDKLAAALRSTKNGR